MIARLLRWPATLVRTLFFYVFGVFWTGLMAYLLVIPVALVARLLGRRESTFAHSVLHFWVPLCSLPWRLIARVRMLDEHRVAEGEAVVISNHHSYIDIFLLFHIFPRIRMTTRRTLYRIPFLGCAIMALGHIPHREEDPQEAIDEAAKWLERGIFVGVFPEGTRAPADEIGPFHSGAFRLAQRTTQLIQPVVVVGTGEVWGKSQFWIHRIGPVVMKVLPPVRVPAEAGRAELKRLIGEVRRLMLEEHQGILNTDF
jgi:1-acyl-sn-glycerol-3-phosphate acyltransferase